MYHVLCVRASSCLMNKRNRPSRLNLRADKTFSKLVVLLIFKLVTLLQNENSHNLVIDAELAILQQDLKLVYVSTIERFSSGNQLARWRRCGTHVGRWSQDSVRCALFSSGLSHRLHRGRKDARLKLFTGGSRTSPPSLSLILSLPVSPPTSSVARPLSSRITDASSANRSHDIT